MVFMLSPKQMLAATDCKRSHRDRCSKHCIPFRKHQWTIRRSGQPVLVPCISRTDRHRDRALLRRPTRPLGRQGSHWIQATLPRGGNPHYPRTSVRALRFVGIGHGSTIPGDYHIGARKLLNLFMEMNCVQEAGSVISQA
jgi:hypothetical protein